MALGALINIPERVLDRIPLNTSGGKAITKEK